MALTIALLLLVGVLLVFRPMVQQKRERKTAEQLKKVKHPAEASAIVDGLINTTRHESNFIQNALKHIWPSLFR